MTDNPCSSLLLELRSKILRNNAVVKAIAEAVSDLDMQLTTSSNDAPCLKCLEQSGSDSSKLDLILTLLQIENQEARQVRQQQQKASDAKKPCEDEELHKTVAELVMELRATKQLLADATRERDAACHKSHTIIERIRDLVSMHAQ